MPSYIVKLTRTVDASTHIEVEAKDFLEAMENIRADLAENGLLFDSATTIDWTSGDNECIEEIVEKGTSKTLPSIFLRIGDTGSVITEDDLEQIMVTVEEYTYEVLADIPRH